MPTAPTETANHLLDLLHAAEDIEVREVSLQNRQRIFSSLDKFLRATDGADQEERAFVIRVRRKKEPEPTETSVEIPKDRAYLLKSAEMLLASQDYLLARNVYSYLLKDDIRDQDALKGLGICLFHLGDTDSARKCFRAISDPVRSEEALYWIGATYQKQGNEALALDHFRRVTQPEALPPDSRYAYYKDLGNGLTLSGQFDAAVEAYRKALRLQPASSQVETNLGTLEIQRGELETAKTHFEKALEFDPKNGRAHCGLGILARAHSSTVEAERHFERALEQEPPNRIALLQLVEIAHHLKSYSKARERLTTYLEKHPSDAEMHFALANILAQEGEWFLCERSLDKALELEPQHDQASRLKQQLHSRRKTT